MSSSFLQLLTRLTNSDPSPRLTNRQLTGFREALATPSPKLPADQSTNHFHRWLGMSGIWDWLSGSPPDHPMPFPDLRFPAPPTSVNGFYPQHPHNSAPLIQRWVPRVVLQEPSCQDGNRELVHGSDGFACVKDSGALLRSIFRIKIYSPRKTASVATSKLDTGSSWSWSGRFLLQWPPVATCNQALRESIDYQVAS